MVGRGVDEEVGAIVVVAVAVGTAFSVVAANTTTIGVEEGLVQPTKWRKSKLPLLFLTSSRFLLECDDTPHCEGPPNTLDISRPAFEARTGGHLLPQSIARRLPLVNFWQEMSYFARPGVLD